MKDRSLESRGLCVLVALFIWRIGGAAAFGGLVQQHHGSVHRQVVSEGSQVRLQCRIPAHPIGRLMMDRATAPESAAGPTVMWLRADRKDPSSQEVISHGETLLVESNPRLRISFQEETGVSMLIIDRAEIQDGGVFQCQMVVEEEVVPSVPIEVIIEERKKHNHKYSSSGSDSVYQTAALLVLLSALIALFTH